MSGTFSDSMLFSWSARDECMSKECEESWNYYYNTFLPCFSRRYTFSSTTTTAACKSQHTNFGNDQKHVLNSFNLNREKTTRKFLVEHRDSVWFFDDCAERDQNLILLDSSTWSSSKPQNAVETLPLDSQVLSVELRVEFSQPSPGGFDSKENRFLCGKFMSGKKFVITKRRRRRCLNCVQSTRRRLDGRLLWRETLLGYRSGWTTYNVVTRSSCFRMGTPSEKSNGKQFSFKME